MFPIYLFALIVGGGLLIFSLLGDHSVGSAEDGSQVDNPVDAGVEGLESDTRMLAPTR